MVSRPVTGSLLGVVAVLIAIAASVVATLVETPRRPARARWWKMLASSGFLAVALLAGAPATLVGRVVLLGLALSWLGDLALTFRGARAFLLGLSAFALAHVAYAAAFLLRGVSIPVVVTAGVMIGIAAMVLWQRFRAGIDPSLRGPVAGYIVLIGTMTATAAGTTAMAGDARIVVGAVAFLLSDVAVASDRFLPSGRPARVWGLPLYYLGQVLLALAA